MSQRVKQTSIVLIKKISQLEKQIFVIFKEDFWLFKKMHVVIEVYTEKFKQLSYTISLW